MNLATQVQAFTATVSVATGSGADTETIQIQMPLTRKLNGFLRLRHLKMLERFDRFEFVGPDHIHAELGWTSEHQVWESLGQATRTIRFMDQTGLLPTSEEIYGFKTFSPQHRLPGLDHATTWRDPETNIILVLDEPHDYVDTLFSDRRDWAARNGFALRRLNYEGTYRPGCGIVCEAMYRIEETKLVQKIISRIEKLDSLLKMEDLGRANLDV